MNATDALSAATCLVVPAGMVATVLVLGSGSKAGVYLYRTRKPGALLGWPVIGRHTAYVGQTKSFGHRHRQHTGRPIANDPYARAGAMWCDLAPRCYRIPLPPWRWLLLLVEWLMIKIMFPVYNVKHNKANPRRISQFRALQQRRSRDLQAHRGIVLGVGVRLVAALRWYHLVGSVVLVSVSVGWLA